MKTASTFKEGNIPWNKGLLADSDNRLKSGSKYNFVAPFIKHCPDCNSIIEYHDKYTLAYSLKYNRKCNTCGNKGKGFQSKVYPYDRTDIINKKSRVSAIEYISSCKSQCVPRYNKNSIFIIEQKAFELGIVDLQHAENGGEFHIKELGYFIDGYSKSKNIVIEYDEPHHFNKDGKLKLKDVQRQSEIENYLGCTFIRIKEN